MFKFLLCTIGLFSVSSMFAQENFSRKDSLIGGLRDERTSYDVMHYDVNLKVIPSEKRIVGFNEISFKVLKPTSKIQIDLFENMNVDSILYKNKPLRYHRDFGAVFIDFEKQLDPNSETQKVKFYYSGKPIEAVRAPWDGGFVWKKDHQGNPWMGIAVQGTGGSLWLPVKDSQSDEPDFGVSLKIAVPDGLMNVSNGKFAGSTKLSDGYTRWDWEVKNPINAYNITLNVGNYVHIHDKLDDLSLDYYVLRDNEHIAKQHFKEDVVPMMECFQSKFGKYPFPEDGYKLVESSYLGMEHQSAVAYGNKFEKGYLGGDISQTGIGLLFDFIIIHETGHEWFGNSITSKDIADMWIHEAFTTYSESVFVECQYGYEKGQEYINGQKQNIQNDKPIISAYGVNSKGSGDMYYKGALMLNTLRHVINNDTKWWAMLKKYSETYRHKIIETKDVVDFFNLETGKNLTPIFDHYLRTTKIPYLSLKEERNKLIYNWENVEDDFNLPIDITVKKKKIRIHPTTKEQTLKVGKFEIEDVSVNTNDFLILLK